MQHGQRIDFPAGTVLRNGPHHGKKVSLCHFNYINPLPKGVRDIFAKFRRIVVCELNEGQFAAYLRQNFQEFPYEQYNKCEGLPFTVAELKQKFESLLK